MRSGCFASFFVPRILSLLEGKFSIIVRDCRKIESRGGLRRWGCWENLKLGDDTCFIPFFFFFSFQRKFRTRDYEEEIEEVEVGKI